MISNDHKRKPSISIIYHKGSHQRGENRFVGLSLILFCDNINLSHINYPSKSAAELEVEEEVQQAMTKQVFAESPGRPMRKPVFISNGDY